MTAYDNYKSSRIEWLGLIPEHWDVKKLNYVCKYQIGGTPPTGNSDSFHGENKWLNISDIGDGKYIFDTEKRISDNAIKDNNILLSPKGGLLFSFKLSIGQVCFVGTELYTNEAVATFLPSSKINLDYAYYMFPVCVVKNAKQNIYGADLLNQELIASAKICYPPIAEQQQIAEYLDQQTTKIDNLVQKQNKLIELLQEKKKSLINHVVTKGLNPNIQMKDSGIEWLGQIPEHWEVKKLKHLFEIVKRLYLSEDKPIISITQNGLKIKDTEKNDGQHAESYSGYQLVKINDFAMNSMDLLTGYVDCSVFEGVTSPDYRVFRFWQNNIQNYNYYKNLFQMCYFNKVFYGYGQGVSTFGRWRLQTEVFLNFMLPVPPLLEQQQIAEYLDQQTAKIDQLINKAKSMVELLKEYKQNLINNVVTGKIKVTS